MKKSIEVKERIIEATINLINESAGDVADINTRDISERAGVGSGMVNYHFQTKENLIEICVERIVGSVISDFKPEFPPMKQTPIEMVKHKAKLVFDFFVTNPAVTRISMLTDFKTPKEMDNTIKSITGIKKTIDSFPITEQQKFILSFALASTMQAMFLRKELFGYNMNIKEQRDEVIDFLVESIFGIFGN